MSIKLMAKAWDTAIPSGQKFVFVALCDHANDDGVCYPSREKLMKKCSMGKTTVYNHVCWLEENGWISSERRQKGGSRLSDLYQINVEKLLGEGSESERSKSERSQSEGSKSEPCKVQNLNGEGSKSEPSYNEYNHQYNHQYNYNNNAGACETALPTEAFAMHLDWQPQNLQAVNSLLRMAGLPMFDRNDANLNAAFADFVGFWFAKPDTLRTAREWDVRFAQSAVEYWRKHYCPHPAYQQRQDDWAQGEARLKGEGVPEQLASEHMALRRAKRVPLTDTALNALKAEAAKAGLSLADVVRHMVQNNWVRFEAAWLNKAGNGFTPTVREVTQAEAGSGGIIDPRTGQKVAVEIEVNADDIDF